MTWNLRLVDMSDSDDVHVEIREVYYDQLGKPIGHTTATMSGESPEEVKQYLSWALDSLDKPIIHFGD
jgi:hypothetical protein